MRKYAQHVQVGTEERLNEWNNFGDSTFFAVVTIGFTLTDGDLLETPVRIIGRLLSSTPLIGDFTGDGVVGFADFLLFAVAFGSSNSRFDLTDDGVVGFQDFLIFANMFRSGN